MIDNDLGMELLERPDMAKKKAADKAKAQQDIILVYKADNRISAEFKAWLEGLAEHLGLQVTSTIDFALKRLAAQEKYTPMPKRRTR